MTILISKQQMKMLEPFALENCISELVVHCDASFPHLKKMMGEEKLRQTLKTAVDMAEQRGFTQKGPVQFYIDMMIMFGVDFENDPQYQWIKASLKKNSQLSQIEKSTILFHQTEDYLNEIFDENNEYLLQVTNEVENITRKEINKDRLTQDTSTILKKIYPQKFKLMTEHELIGLIQLGVEKSKKNYGFEYTNQIALVTILMFLLGHQFDANPFHTWVSKEDLITATKNQDEVLNRLAERTKRWLESEVQNAFMQTETTIKREESYNG